MGILPFLFFVGVGFLFFCYWFFGWGWVGFLGWFWIVFCVCVCVFLFVCCCCFGCLFVVVFFVFLGGGCLVLLHFLQHLIFLIKPCIKLKTFH